MPNLDEWYVDVTDIKVHTASHSGTGILLTIELVNGKVAPTSTPLPPGVARAVRAWLSKIDLDEQAASVNKKSEDLECFDSVIQRSHP